MLCFLGLINFTGCKKFLEVTSDTQKQVGQSFRTIEDLRASTAFLYTAPWSKFHRDLPSITDGRANNLYIDGVTGTLAAISLFAENSNFIEFGIVWSASYVAITQADYIIKDYVPLAISNGVEEAKAKACEGEARFMRGTAYWYLAMLWHDVPIIDDPRTVVLNTVLPPNRFEDVLQYAINDLTIAAELLPTTDTKGRVTKYSAKAMLARLCLTAANFAQGNRFSADYLTRNNVGDNAQMAQKYYEQVMALTESVITESNYEILDDFEDLFKTQNNNNKEVLFGVQYVPGLTESDLRNPMSERLAYSREITGDLGGGSSIFVSYDMLKWFVDDGALSRLRGSVCVPGQNYSYIGTHLPAGSWTVPSGKTKCNLKKYMVGSTKDTDGAAVLNNSGLVPAIIRMAEVYLMYTEAAMGISDQTSDVKALKYFNKVRGRAFKLNLADFQPYTMVTRNDLLKERRLEFFFEGLYWPDLVRRSFYDMDWVLNFLNNKLKDSNADTEFTSWASYSYTFDPLKYPNNKGWDNSPRQQAGYIPQQVVHNVADGSYVHAVGSKSNIWAFAYPSVEASANPKLNSEPVPYQF